jgi:hypothetical protein
MHASARVSARRWLVTGVAAAALVLLTPGVSHSSTVPPSPQPTQSAATPTTVTTTPDHGPWVVALVVGGFVGAGVLTLLLARHRVRAAGDTAEASPYPH